MSIKGIKCKLCLAVISNPEPYSTGRASWNWDYAEHDGLKECIIALSKKVSELEDTVFHMEHPNYND